MRDCVFDIVVVVPVLFGHSLKDGDDQRVPNLDHIFDVEPMKVVSPSSDAEVALALRVLEGCCLLHRESSILAHQHKAIQVPFAFYYGFSLNYNGVSFFVDAIVNMFVKLRLQKCGFSFLV